MYLTFLLLRYIIDRHLEYVRMGGICSGIEVAITRTIRNRLTVDPVRGFESHPLRHVGASCISLAPTFLKSERAHCAAPPFQIEPASLGFDLVLGAISKENRFDPLIATCVDKNMHSKNAA